LAGSPHGAAGKNESRPRPGVLVVRILAGAVMVAVVLTVNYLGGLWFTLFLGACSALASWEFYHLCSQGMGARLSGVAGIAGTVAVCLSFQWASLEISGLVLTAVVILILLERLSRQDTGSYIRAVGMTVLGLVYVGWLAGFFILLRKAVGISTGGTPTDGPGPGHWYVLLVLILTWSYDTMAYFGGSFLGRHGLFSRISPAKTVEGTAIGLGASVAAALICREAFAGFLGSAQAVLVGLMIGVVAQAGDLVESIVKRSTNTKDSSHIIPGHGGILDRLDSLLFTAPVFYIYLRAVTEWMGR
jgi:phosphatidate cytidylyltransferase